MVFILWLKGVVTNEIIKLGDYLDSSGDRDKGVSITISIVGWTITMGLRISTNTSNSNSRLSNNSNWLSNTDELSGMSITIVSSLLVKSTLLSGNLSGNRLANLSGNWLALLSWDSNCDWEWDSSALGNWLGNTLGVRHSSGDCVTCGHWLWHTNCLWDSSGDGVTFLSCNRAALGD